MGGRRARLFGSTVIAGSILAFGSAAVGHAQTGLDPAGAGQAPLAQPQTAPPPSTNPNPLDVGARAPEATLPPSAAPTVQEVVVTGSLIRQPNLTATSPLTVVGGQEFKLQGATNVEDVLNSLPSVFASESENVSNGSTGTATVNLRGLGDQRTLVLVDGRRVGTGDPGDAGAVDLNLIPSALVQRVDVVTGGASSIYGSDAVAGVVNFIMVHNFQGLRLDGNFEGFEHDNSDGYVEGLESARGFGAPNNTWYGGKRIDVTAILGANTPDGKGNFTGYVGYRNIGAVTEGNLDYSACALGESGNGLACSGSGTTTSARFITGAGDDLFLDKSTNMLRAYNSATDAFNYAPYNYYQRPDERYVGGFFAHYAVNPKVDVYSDFMYMDDTTTSQIAPSGLFGESFTLPCSDGLLNASELNALCGGSTSGTFTSNILRRNVEGGTRDFGLDHNEFRIVLGARGDLNDAWRYDVYGQFFRSRLSADFTGDISLSRAGAALSDCTAGYTIGSGCVPYDIFTTGGVTSSAINYIEANAYEQATTTQQVVSATVNGDLGKYGLRSPWAADGLSVAFGTDYRRETSNFQPDEELTSGDLASAGTVNALSGAYDVYEVYAELRTPLISDKPFIKDLSLDSAYRFSDYSTSGDTSTYSVEGNYSVSRDFRVRASFNRAERAPDISELFTAQGIGNELSYDGCTGATPDYTLAECEHSGVTPAQYGHIVTNSAADYNGLYGGNPDLKPEIADTYSAGFVLTPRIAPNFNLTIDYFNIYIANVIESISPQYVLDQCEITGDGFYCDKVHRSAIGSLWLGQTGYVVDTLVNAGSEQTSGVDIQANYSLRLPELSGHATGAVSFNLIGTYLASFTSENIPGSGNKYNCAGFYGDTCGQPNPTWRHKLRATWSTPWNVDVSADWRYVGGVRNDGYIANVGDNIYGYDAKVPAVNYLDLTLSTKIKNRYTLRVGVKNIFDQQPPIIGTIAGSGGGSVYNGNTFAGVYDVLGRNLFAGITADFN